MLVNSLKVTKKSNCAQIKKNDSYKYISKSDGQVPNIQMQACFVCSVHKEFCCFKNM